MAAWHLFQTWLPPKRAKRVRKSLRMIRQTAGEARDLDVLRDRVKHEFGEDARDVITHVESRRHKIQPKIIRVADRLRKRDRLADDVRRLIKSIDYCCNKRSCDECAPFQKWAENRLKQLSEEFFNDLPGEDASPESLHEFRVRSKALRYALELVAPVLGGDLREVHYAVVEELQERLGTINDHATAAARFERWAKREKSADLKREFMELAKSERQCVESETRDFHLWWTAERAESLRAGLTLNSEKNRGRTVLV
jgi:CHAD domain-containing protein